MRMCGGKLPLYFQACVFLISTGFSAATPPPPKLLANYGNLITTAECTGFGWERELELQYSGKHRPYALNGPPAHCDTEGCKHSYWGKRARFQPAENFWACAPELRAKLQNWLVDWAREGAVWAQDALLAKPCQLWPLLQGRTLWVIGDSLSKDLADALDMFLVEYHVYDPAKVQTLTTRADVMDVIKPSEDSKEHEASCIQLEGSSRICFIRAMKVPSFLRMAPVLPEIVAPRDIVILNWGLHYNDMEEYRKDMAAFAAVFPEEVQSKTGAKFLWRETTPQHFETPTGSYLANSGEHEKDSCQPLGLNLDQVGNITIGENGTLMFLPQPGPQSRPPSGNAAADLMTILAGGPRNVISQPVIDSLGLPTLRVWNATVPLWEFHPSGGGTNDCTHFCPPSWSQVHLGKLQQLILGSVADEVVAAA